MIKKIFTFFIFTFSVYASVNPMVMSNMKQLEKREIFTLLPNNQIINKNCKDSKEFSSKFLIYPYETLMIKTKNQEKENIKINLESSLDGKLFYTNDFDFAKDGIYRYKNDFNKTMAINLFVKNSCDMDIFTTISDKKIDAIPSTKIELSGEKVNIISKKDASKSIYYSFEKDSHIEFDVQGDSTLQISMRAIVDPLENLSPYRQKILVIDDENNSKSLEALNTLSPNYIDDANKSAVTELSSHFIPLKKGKHNIKIQTFSPILLSVEIYQDNLINNANDANLKWQATKDFDSFNQAIWKNSNVNDGIKRANMILKSGEEIIDSKLFNGLKISSQKSTFMEELLPNKIPFNSTNFYAYYGITSLYPLEDKEVLIDSSREINKYDISYLNKINEGFFVQIPKENKDIEYKTEEMIIEKLYFKRREFLLDEALEYQLSLSHPKLQKYEEIHLYGYTDTKSNASSNYKLSLKRTQSVKDALIKLGISSEKIIIHPLGENKLAVNTSDETLESANRRVEIVVIEKKPLNKELKYIFKEPLQSDTQIQITTLTKSNKKDFSLKLNIDDKRVIKLKNSTEEKDLEAYSFSSELDSYERLDKNFYKKSKDILEILNDGKKRELEQNSSTTMMVLPKGTKYIKVTKEDSNDDISISIQIPSSSIYKDTNYALSNEYAGTYLNFVNSLNQSESFQKAQEKFDAWYEHTNILRLWMQSQISQANNNLTKKIPSLKDIEYAKELIKNSDDFTALQIAKHALILSPDFDIQKKAYDILCEISKDDISSLLVWKTIYFSKTKLASTLFEIAILLEKDNKFDLSLTAFLILPKENMDKQKVCDLAILQNNFLLAKDLCEDKNIFSSQINILNKKEELLKINDKKIFQKEDDSNIKATNFTKLYSKNRNLFINKYKSTWEQPLEIQVDGLVELEINTQFLDMPSEYRWLTIEDNNIKYQYPLTQIKESENIIAKSDNKTVSLESSIKIKLSKGLHKLKIYSVSDPILVSVNSRKLDNNENVEPLEKQILKIDDFSFDNIDKNQTDSISYASSLLYIYENASPLYKYKALAQAILLDQETKNKDVKTILGLITPYNRFSAYNSSYSPLGYFDIDVPNWNPISTFQKNRTPLIGNIDNFDFVLTGEDYKVIHLSQERDISLEFEQLSLDYFVSKMILFAIEIDGKEELYQFAPDTNVFLKNIKFSAGEHSIKIRILNPISTQYLGVKIKENSQRIKEDNKKRYSISTQSEPIIIEDIGPKLFQIEERFLDNKESVISYLYLKDDKAYSEKIYPSKNSSKSFYSISELVLDTLVKPLKNITKPSIIPISLVDNEIKDEPIETFNKTKLILTSTKPTYSAQVGINSKESAVGDESIYSSKMVGEIGGYYRNKIDEDLYIRAHYFTRLYSNPLYAFEHRAYLDLPKDDMYLITQANIYTQEKDFLYKKLYLNAKLMQKSLISNQIRHEYGAEIFNNYMDFDNGASNNSLDSLVYSKYKQDHRYGVGLNYSIYYRAYDDLEFLLDTKLVSNENFTFDYYKLTPTLRHLVYPFYLNLYYENRYYFSDEDRQNAYNSNKVGLKAQYEKLFSNDRLQIEAEIARKIETENNQISLFLTWFFNDNNSYYNFSPDEIAFKNLRLLNEEE